MIKYKEKKRFCILYYIFIINIILKIEGTLETVPVSQGLLLVPPY